MTKNNEIHEDIKRIGDLLVLARAEGVSEIDAEIPFYTTSIHHGLMRVKAKWNPTNE